MNTDLKRREWVAETKGVRGTQKQHDKVQIDFKEIGKGTYLITLDKGLSKGELFFSVMDAEKVYAFGLNK